MKKATRDAIGDFLPIMGEKYKEILVLGLDLAGATKTISFKKKFPERFIDVGIAEANGIGIASGLSEHGFKVFVPSFGSFLTGRYDQIRCSLAYSKSKNVVLVGTHVGMAIGKDGVTQMALEDISIMRALPNVTILNPATYSEAEQVIEYLCENELDGPHYLRLGRQPIEDIFEDDTGARATFQFNRAKLVKGGDEICLLTTGCILPEVLEAAKKIESIKNLTVRVINFATLKPIDEKMIIGCAQDSDYLFSVEDHTIVGGFGSIVSEVLTDKHPKKLVRIGLNDQFPESGPPDKLYEKYGLSSQKIFERVLGELNG